MSTYWTRSAMIVIAHGNSQSVTKVTTSVYFFLVTKTCPQHNSTNITKKKQKNLYSFSTSWQTLCSFSRIISTRVCSSHKCFLPFSSLCLRADSGKDEVKGKLHLYSTTITAYATSVALSSQAEPANSLGRSQSPQS